MALVSRLKFYESFLRALSDLESWIFGTTFLFIFQVICSFLFKQLLAGA
jgi:hypothetical protein